MQQQDPIFTKRFNLLFISNMAVFLVFYALITVFPLYVLTTLKGTQDQAGLLVSVFMVSAIVVRPFSGKLLDVYGKKPLLVIGAIFYLICTILYAMTDSLSLLLVLRFAQGIAFSIVTTGCMSLAADIIPKARKGAGLGYFMMSSNLAIVLGPFLGLILMQYGSFEAIFIVLGIIMAMGTFCAVSIKTDDMKPISPKPKLSFKINDLFEKKAVPVALIGLLVAFSYATVLSFISLYAEEKELLNVASYFYLVFAVGMLGVRPLSGKIYDSKGPMYTIIPALIIFAVGLYVLSTIHGAFGLLVAAFIIGVGYGTVAASLQAQAVQSASPSRSSYVTATYYTLFDLGIALGSYVFGIVVTYVDFSAIYKLGSIIVLCVIVLYSLLMKRNYSKKELSEC